MIKNAVFYRTFIFNGWKASFAALNRQFICFLVRTTQFMFCAVHYVSKPLEWTSCGYILIKIIKVDLAGT